MSAIERGQEIIKLDDGVQKSSHHPTGPKWAKQGELSNHLFANLDESETKGRPQHVVILMPCVFPKMKFVWRVVNVPEAVLANPFFQESVTGVSKLAEDKQQVINGHISVLICIIFAQ